MDMKKRKSPLRISSFCVGKGSGNAEGSKGAGTRLRREGSKGSEGSKVSEGGGIAAFGGDEFYILPAAATLPEAAKTIKPGLRPVGNAPLSPPAAVLPPEGEVCSMLSPCVNLSCSLHNGTKRVHFCCGDPAEGLQVGRSLSLACTQKDLPMNRPTDEARLYGFSPLLP